MKNKYKHFKSILCITILVMSPTIFSYGQNLKITHGPFIQHLTTNSVVINWSTSVDCISWVEYYEDDGSNFYQKERLKIYNSTDGLKCVGELQHVSLENLKEDTRYAYRIYSQAITKEGNLGKTVATRVFKSQPLYFSTLNSEKEQTSCVILCDMHGYASKVATLLNNVEWNKTDFVLLNGDFVQMFNNDKDLYNVLDTCVNIFAKEKPLYIVRGNHETRGSKAGELKEYFHFPENKYYYTFTLGNSFFIVLDSGEDKPDSDIEYHGQADFDLYRSKQAEWLSKVVASEEFKRAEHKIVFMHIPPFTDKRGAEWHGEVEVRNKFVPILNQVDIDLMICGHKHSYSFFPIRPDENNFPVLVVDNNSRVDLVLDEKGVSVKTVNMDSEIISDLFFNKK